MSRDAGGRGGARTCARGLEHEICGAADRRPACSRRSWSLHGGISLASAKGGWKRFGCFPGRGGKVSGSGQGQECPDISGLVSAFSFSFGPGCGVLACLPRLQLDMETVPSDK